jgi:hypothetical protein
MLIPGSLIFVGTDIHNTLNTPVLVVERRDPPIELKSDSLRFKLSYYAATDPERWQYDNLITVTLYFLYNRETFKLTVLKSIEHNRVDKISAYLFDGRYVLRYES